MRLQAEEAIPCSLHQELSSSAREVDNVCLGMSSFLGGHGLMELVFPVEVALRECLNNAIYHGNGGNLRKKVIMDASIGKKWLRIIVQDEGEGFDWRRKKTCKLPDATTPSGRGTHMITLYTDRVQYNRCGNKVTMWFYKQRKI